MHETRVVKIRPVAGSLVISVPRDLVERAGMIEGQQVAITASKGQISVLPILTPQPRRRSAK